MGNGGRSDFVEGTGVDVLLVAVFFSSFREFGIRFWRVRRDDQEKVRS